LFQTGQQGPILADFGKYMMISTYSGPLRWLCFSLTFPLVQSLNIFGRNATPLQLSQQCREALEGDIDCNPVVTSFQEGQFYSKSTLDITCKSDCYSSLDSYRKYVISSCGNQSWDEFGSSPIALVPELLGYNFNIACLKDSDRYCNNVGAAYAAALDPTGVSHQQVDFG
jgi:hypothetical protein